MQDAAPVSGCSHPRTSPSPGHRPVEPLCPNSSYCELFRAPAKTPEIRARFSRPGGGPGQTYVQPSRCPSPALRSGPVGYESSLPLFLVSWVACLVRRGRLEQHLKRSVLRLGLRRLPRGLRRPVVVMPPSLFTLWLLSAFLKQWAPAPATGRLLWTPLSRHASVVVCRAALPSPTSEPGRSQRINRPLPPWAAQNDGMFGLE